jgi:hypothetical protein
MKSLFQTLKTMTYIKLLLLLSATLIKELYVYELRLKAIISTAGVPKWWVAKSSEMVADF